MGTCYSFYQIWYPTSFPPWLFVPFDACTRLGRPLPRGSTAPRTICEIPYANLHICGWQVASPLPAPLSYMRSPGQKIGNGLGFFFQLMLVLAVAGEVKVGVDQA